MNTQRWRFHVADVQRDQRVVVGDCLTLLRLLPDSSVDAVVTDPPAGIAFMNKEWDDFRRARSTNDAGRCSVHGRMSRSGSEYGRGSRASFIAWLTERMMECLRVLKPGGHMLVWSIPRTSHWTATALEDAGFDVRDRVSHFFGTGFPKSVNLSKAIDKRLGAEPVVVGANPNHRPVSGTTYEGVYAGGNTGAAVITEPSSSEAKQWQGFGTALKPACEDWWLVRKPLDGTVVANVLDHGTGALNIDACRITTDEPLTRKLNANTESTSGWKSTNRSPVAGKDGGRWPAHITFDEEAAAVLDEQSGPGVSRKGRPRKGRPGDGYGMTHTGAEYNDAGGASRFYYVAKPTRSERDAGPTRNVHPTVKSINLMRWLVRLVTPPGGLVLDPFTGSGTTGIACVHEGFRFKGFEQSEEYAEIARKRIKHAESGR